MIEGLYSIIKQSTDEVVIKLASKDHPVFQAHFPNNPILPGFALIDIMEKVLNDNIVYISKSKFISHMLPDDILRCSISITNNKKNIKIFKNEEKVSEIIYETK